MGVPKCPSMTDCGSIVLRKRLGLRLSMIVLMMRIKHLQLAPHSAKERRSLVGETSTEETEVADQMADLVVPEVMRGRTT